MILALLLLASQAFAQPTHIGGTTYSLTYPASTISFPYTTAQNASGNYFYVAMGVDGSSAASFAYTNWGGQVGTLITGVQCVSGNNEGIYLWQFSSPSTITSSNVTVTAIGGGIAYPSITVDEFSGVAGFTQHGTTGGIGQAVGLTINHLTITAASSITFSVAVTDSSGATTQPTGWALLTNTAASGYTDVTSAWGISVTGATGATPFHWTSTSGYSAVAAFEMQLVPTPTATPTPLPTPTPKPGTAGNPFYIIIAPSPTP